MLITKMLIKVRIFCLAPKIHLIKIHDIISLIAFFVWVGLGADGISSSSYGPEEAFLALGAHKDLAIYLAIATALTVFIISYAYCQVVELFPGEVVATELLQNYLENMLALFQVVPLLLTMF